MESSDIEGPFHHYRCPLSGNLFMGSQKVGRLRTGCVSLPQVVVAEWLRRWTRNPLGSPRAGSNPADYVSSCAESEDESGCVFRET